MGKNKDKAKKADKKEQKRLLKIAEAQQAETQRAEAAAEAAEEFPAEAPVGADEKAAKVEAEPARSATLTKKEKKAVEALEVGEVHDFPRGMDQIHRVGFLNGLVADPETKKKVRAKAEAELQGYRDRGTALMYERNRQERKEKAEAKEGTKKKAAEPAPIIETAPEVDEEVAAIKARVDAKRKERYEAMIADGASEESARQMSRFQAIRDEDPKGLTLGKTGQQIMTANVHHDDASNATNAAALDREEPDETEPPMTEPLVPVSRPKKTKGKAKAAEPVQEPETPAQVAEEVQTETGREFAVGAAAEEADDLDPDENDGRDAEGVRWSKHASPRPYIFQPDGKEALYSRMTSYIDVLDEKGGLQDWKDRMLLVGIARAAAELDPELQAIDIVGAVNRLTDRTESAIKKADKAMAKGKMTVDEHTAAVEEAEREYNAEARRLAEDMRDRGGAHDKAQKGTDLHKVFEDFDNAKMEDKALTVDEWARLLDGQHRPLSKADVRDLRAYRAAVEEAGIEFLACEQRVVLDEYKVTGTLDRSIMATPPGASRRVRMVGDVKTGRMDLGVGKFATQVYGYAMGEGYANSTERVDLKHSKKWGVIFHSPAGQGKTTVWFMDLSKGAEGWKHIEAVRDWRRTTTEAQTFRGKSPYMFEGVSATAHEDGTTEVNTPDAA